MLSSRRLILLLTPLWLFGTIWIINWWRLHPPPTALDKQIRDLLLSSDRVTVEVETIEYPKGGSSSKVISHLSPSETYSIVSYINVTQEQPKMWGTGYVPIVYLHFHKQGKPLGSLCSSYAESGYNYFLAPPSDAKPQIRQGLHHTTLLRLRNLIAQHPEITGALIAMGTEPHYLNPNAFVQNDP